MIRIEIEQSAPGGRREFAVEWPAVPRVGESIDLQSEDEDETLRRPHGAVRTVVWWLDGSVRIVLEPIRI